MNISVRAANDLANTN